MTFSFHRQPLAHQLRDFERFKDSSRIPLFYEMRAGKTKVILDIFRYRYQRGDVDALMIFADPKGVEMIWLDELPKDLSPEELTTIKTLAWQAGKTTETKARREEALALRAHRGPIVVTFYAGTLITPKGWKYIEWLLQKRRAMVVADEASWAGRWNARTKRLLTLGGFYSKQRQPNVIVKAILEGTPCDERPDDVFYPTQFLSRGLLGFDSPNAFKARYHDYETEVIGGVEQKVMRRNHRTNTDYPVFRGYRNLEELKGKLSQVGSRVLRSDVSDAPAKIYSSRYFELTPKQRRVYEQARSQYVLELSSGDRPLRDVLLRMTRLQQICRNYAPPERVGMICSRCDGGGSAEDGSDCETCEGLGMTVGMTALERIDDRNPAMEALLAEIEATRGPVVIGARFHQDVTDVIDAARAVGKTILRYDGMILSTEREENYQAFRSGKGDGIAGTVTSGLSKGKDLTRARAVVFYSNWYGARPRRQFEDRAEGLSRDVATDIVDLLAIDTRDVDIVNLLRGKRDIASLIHGDPPSKWL